MPERFHSLDRKSNLFTRRLLKNLRRFLPFVGKMKVGLALGSGAARGLAHIGVIKCLREEGIPIDCVSGSSAGALVGAFLAAGKFDVLDAFAASLTGWESLKLVDPMLIPKGGIVEGKRVEKFFRDRLGDVMIENLPIPFACVSTDYLTGKEVVLNRGDLVTAVRASISIPGIFKPVPYGSMLLIDGGVVNPVPVSVARDLGADIVIAVDVSAKIKKDKKTSGGFSGGGMKTSEGKGDPAEKIPGIFEIFMGAITIMGTEINAMRMHRENPEIVISPMVNHLGLLDFHKYSLGVIEGERAAREELFHIKRLLGMK